MLFNFEIKMSWILAKKLEMTRVIKGDRFIPITLLEIPVLKVVWLKTLEKDWYEAILVWILKKWCEVKLEDWKASLAKNCFSEIREFPVKDGDLEKYKVWNNVNLDSLDGVEMVSLSSKSKWKWFTWAMKKHNFSGWPAWHGSKFHRALGSIGNRKPTRTHKWKKMHGHHWDIKITLKKVPVELVNKEASIIGVRGWVPWARNTLVSIYF